MIKIEVSLISAKLKAKAGNTYQDLAYSGYHNN